MIRDSEERYLATRPDRTVEVLPFDPRARETGRALVAELERSLPGLRVHFGGAAALGLAGQNDIDISILSSPVEYAVHEPAIIQLYGEPTKRGSSVKWEFVRDGFDVELYLTDKDSPSLHDQIRVFELLSSDPTLRAEYEAVKLPLGPVDFKTYMRKKYAFYNRILDRSNQHE